mmetsp:Transcript_1114/g.3417  ORF Transcript_1114/g.3417 Transcript_1114/m.3417 type:complete len:323 (+) Transcript_1114:365-1333(+)
MPRRVVDPHGRIPGQHSSSSCHCFPRLMRLRSSKLSVSSLCVLIAHCIWADVPDVEPSAGCSSFCSSDCPASKNASALCITSAASLAMGRGSACLGLGDGFGVESPTCPGSCGCGFCLLFFSGVLAPRPLSLLMRRGEAMGEVFCDPNPPLVSAFCRLLSSLLMTFVSFMTSFTVAPFSARMSSTTSMNSGKSRSSISCPSFSKMESIKSTRPSGSTPTSCRANAASWFVRIFMNSSLEMRPLPSSSSASTIFSIFVLTNSTRICSFSVAATAETTSQSTPMSMFITISAERAMKMRKIVARMKDTCLMSSMTAARLSRKVP